ncbi:50S ribosomal protein L22 [Candidatus Uhrbacteria bacterium RIFCSPHIGHO2_01_FULL_63_20]|uniref:Large ribosomal subunit protein uL22 n=1 Tax=Candidatus Uhrbacteria bacterium RIFCSPHIGHO2_01_FULL_63_20 TaxID=1802385 RepID=A0A1F7TNS5_9BACT|nr:MAG: 50S ribosomal protein L22 [Candidatus Uhrbacteria bacterium RIFCSPHIGHO2_01_FULL_63_20]
MEVSAKARYIRVSPRKVRLVIDVVRGMDVSKAVAQLTFMKKGAALPVLKLVNSATANAAHNFGIDPNTLYIKSIAADGGPVLHRWRARAMGRAAPIRKRMSHVSVTLATRESAVAAKSEANAKKAKPAVKKLSAKKAKATT